MSVTPEQIADSLARRRAVFLTPPSNLQGDESNPPPDNLRWLLSDPSPGAVKVLAEIASFIRFGRLYLLTIEDMGRIE